MIVAHPGSPSTRQVDAGIGCDAGVPAGAVRSGPTGFMLVRHVPEVPQRLQVALLRYDPARHGEWHVAQVLLLPAHALRQL